MRLPSRLQISRHGIYYFRLRIPTELVQLLKRAEIKISLNTGNRQEAVRLSSRVYARVSILLDYLRKGRMDADDVLKNMKNIRQWTAKNLTVGGVTLTDVEVKPGEEAGFLASMSGLATLTPAAPAVAPTPPTLTKTKLLSKAFDDYIAHKIGENEWSDSSQDANRYSYKVLLQVAEYVLGKNPTVEMIGRKEVKEFKKVLLQLPSEKHKFRGKTVTQIMMLVKRDWPTYALSHVNLQLSRLGSALNYWENRDFLPDPAMLSDLKSTRKTSGRRDRFPWEPEELKALFSPKNIVPQIKEPHQLWAPLIALFTGARVAEVGQFYLDDIYEKNGIWVFDINESRPDQNVKSEAGERVVPMHHTLIELGLLDYIDELKEMGFERLFPNCPHNGKDGYGKKPGTWFSRYKIGLGYPSKKKSFHSFRHNVADALRDVGATETMVAMIEGHSLGKGATAIYGSGPGLIAMNGHLQKIQYDLDLSHLHYKRGMFEETLKPAAALVERWVEIKRARAEREARLGKK